MKLVKSVIPIIPIVLILFFIFSTTGVTFAAGSGNDTPIVLPIDPTALFSGSLTVSVNPQVAHVGDIVTITVTATNTGMVDWCPLKIYMPVPSGLQYMSFVVPDRNLQNYDSNTGIWDVYRMRCIERGQQKTAILTAKVLPAAAGKKIKATARFETLVLEGYGVHMENRVAAARADTLDIPSSSALAAVFTSNVTSGLAPLAVQFTDASVGNITGWLWDFGDGTTSTEQNPAHIYNTTGNYTVKLTVSNDEGNNASTKSITVTSSPDTPGDPGIPGIPGSGYNTTNILGNTKLTDALKNLTVSDENDPLLNLKRGGGGGGKAHEVSINPPVQDNSLGMYILAVLLIVGLLIAGYFYGIKREE